MAISEYSVPNDFFQAIVGPPGLLCFPCCQCRHRSAEMDEEPCKFCGHNDGADDHFNCCLCGDIEPGNAQDENYLAMRTPAAVGPMCLTCKNTIKATFKTK